MARAIIGRWGDSLAIPIPSEIVTATGLRDGEQVEIEAKDGDLVIRRLAVHARADAQRAAEEILRESRGRTLGGIAIKDLINDSWGA